MKDVYVKTENLVVVPVSKKDIGTLTRLEETLIDKGFNVVPKQYLFYYNWDLVPKNNITLYKNQNKLYVFCGYKQVRKNVEPCIKLKEVLPIKRKLFK